MAVNYFSQCLPRVLLLFCWIRLALKDFSVLSSNWSNEDPATGHFLRCGRKTFPNPVYIASPIETNTQLVPMWRNYWASILMKHVKLPPVMPCGLWFVSQILHFWSSSLQTCLEKQPRCLSHCHWVEDPDKALASTWPTLAGVAKCEVNQLMEDSLPLQ